MHIALIIWSVFAAWRWGDWKNWQLFHPTMLFFALSSALYDVVVNDKNYYLWRYVGNQLLSEEVASLFYTLIAFPATALTFLSNFPEHRGKQLLHISKYALIYVLLEIVALKWGHIKHSPPWTMWWSLGFDFFMFSILILHHKKPLLAYTISTLFTIFLLIWFDVPLKDTE